MAVVQISRIQHRRGYQQDLPQLASAELGWSVDQRRLFIGNGTTVEGAPSTGVTEILTQHSNITSLIRSYSYVGPDTGYTVSTAPGLGNVVRLLQSKLDDFVNIRDFGAVGDGITDDTIAINQALTQIYSSNQTSTNPRARRIIYFPAGNYVVSNSVKIPPYTNLCGEGPQSSIITQIGNTQPVVATFNSAFNSNAGPTNDLTVSGIGFYIAGTGSSRSAIEIDSVNSAIFFNCSVGAASPVALTTINSTTSTKSITFDQCSFVNGVTGINIAGNNVSSVRAINSKFDNLTTGVTLSNLTIGFSSIGNHYGNVTTPVSRTFNANNVSVGDTYQGQEHGVYAANYKIANGKTLLLPQSATTLVGQVLPGGGEISYTISNGASHRYGTVNYTYDGTTVLFSDNYNETGTGLNANLFLQNGNITCYATTTNTTIKYNTKTFV
jgi:hypothetical protein